MGVERFETVSASSSCNSQQIGLLSTRSAAMPAKSVSVDGNSVEVRKQVQVVVQSSTTRQKLHQNLEMPHYDPARLKKHGKNGQPPPVSVARRNARERNRVKQVNHGFATLREHIPSHVCQNYGDRSKKLSKVETLRMAVEYIRALQRLIAEADGSGFSGSDGLQVSGLASDELHGCTDESEQPDSSGFLDDELEDSKESVLADSKRFLEQQHQHQQHTRSLTEQNRCETLKRYGYYIWMASCEYMVDRSVVRDNVRAGATAPLESLKIRDADTSPTAVLPPVKRELQLIQQQQQEIDSCGPREETILTSSAPYSAQMLIEGVQEARLEPGAQIVYVTTGPDGSAAYYRHELANAGEFIDTWWDQDRQQRLGHV
ncbi:hypothetical protein QAD02_009352 [Eretmocerus hayati]|uniref:Uncharacterized protein n=1 Tax=Eretmocerus hayati TaxID=131215 RepID=A0ACC2N906_9HYME|nr:hypothetical protein QAD02_009352 [Eretmocerus hayati]